MFSVYFIMQMSNGCRLTWFKWVNSIFLFTLIIQTATKKKKRKKPCKRSKGISLFPSQPFPAAQQQSCRADGAGWVLASWWGGCQALAGAARQPRAKNDPRLTQLSGSRVLTNGQIRISRTRSWHGDRRLRCTAGRPACWRGAGSQASPA